MIRIQLCLQKDFQNSKMQIRGALFLYVPLLLTILWPVGIISRWKRSRPVPFCPTRLTNK